MKEVDVQGLALVGEGTHGKVFRIDDKTCIKVCNNESDMQLEYRVLKHCDRFPHFPRVYECQGNYMIREFIDGQNIIEFIREKGFDCELALKLAEIIDVFSELGFTRLDCRLSQIFVTADKNLKVIDTTRHMDKSQDYPRKMLRGLRKLGYRKKFLKCLKEFRPNYYKAWKNK